MAKTIHFVHFRMLRTPCCSAVLCWVNPRFPNFCPECGTNCFPAIRDTILFSDISAQLRVNEAVSLVPVE